MKGGLPSMFLVVLLAMVVRLQLLVICPVVVVTSVFAASIHCHSCFGHLRIVSNPPPPSSSLLLPHRLPHQRYPINTFAFAVAHASRRTTSFTPTHSRHRSTGFALRGDFHDFIYSPDIPYERLPLAQVIRHLAPPPPPMSSDHQDHSNDDYHHITHSISDTDGTRMIIESQSPSSSTSASTTPSPIITLPLLSDAQAQQRLRHIGPNTLPTSRKELSLWEIWWSQFEEDVLAKILACAALVSVISSLSDVWNEVTRSSTSSDGRGIAAAVATGATGGGESIGSIRSMLLHSLIEPLAIIAILLLNAGVGAWQEISARRTLEALEAMQPRLTTVLRRYNNNVKNDEEWEEEMDASITDNITFNNDNFNTKIIHDESYNKIMSNQNTNATTTTAETTTAVPTTAARTTATARWIPNYDATQLVPGDVIRLRAGNAIPADARILSLQSSSSASVSSYSSYHSSLSVLSSSPSSSSYSSMDVDESSLTGESGSVQKSGDVALVGLVKMQNDDHGNIVVENNIQVDDDTSSINQKVSRDATTAATTTTTSNHVPIQDQSSMLFSGCLITRGSGTALVVRTGPHTQMGKIRLATIEAESDGAGRRTPLGEQLQKFGHVLSYVIGGICIAVWIASIPHFADPVFTSTMEGAVYYAKVGVALGVAAIPEGLPSAITLCLSLGARRMAGRNAIVRKLASVETLGCTSVICTDKTGTLTTNQMTAVSFLLLENQRARDESTVGIVEHEVTGNSYNPVGSVVGIDRQETICHPLGSISDACDVMTLCNDARLFVRSADDDVNDIFDSREKSSMDYATAETRIAIEGEPTEAALLCLAEKLGPRDISNNDSNLTSQNYEYFTNRWERYATLEFDRKRKSMGVLVVERSASEIEMTDDNDSDGGRRCKLLVKGAPGMLLDRCSHAKLRDGSIIPISCEIRNRMESAISSIGERALRCIALAVKDGDSFDADLSWKNRRYDEILRDSSKFIDIESGLTFVGLVAIRDPPRQGVSNSIDLCKRAGIRVIMITGDAKATAVAIAKDVHIIPDYNDNDGALMKAFESKEFFAMPHAMQLEILKNGNLVICRAEPTDKRRLVKLLQFLGEIPAMTGDGVNDAPALVQANIGIAMGISGTEVAKEASDMVLVDDNFSTIVDAVKEGRCIYANMQAFINFLITCNIGEVIGVFLASILGYPQLLSPLHILWVNLVTDGIPATALGFNPPDPELMNKKPRPISEELLTPVLLFRYASAGLYIGVATVGIYASYFLDHGVSLDQLSSWSTCAESDSCSIYADLAAPQTLALTTLVTMELIKALCTVSVNSSILKVGPHKNPWLLLGVAVPFAFNLAILYTPAFQLNFGLVPLSREDWFHVLMWSSPIILIDELQKFVSRYQEERNLTAIRQR